MTKTARLFAVFALVLGICHVAAASDPNVCMILENAVSEDQNRFDQAKAALENVNAVCSDDPNPKSCADAIKQEYNDAEIALNDATANYKKAGCESPQP